MCLNVSLQFSASIRMASLEHVGNGKTGRAEKNISHTIFDLIILILYLTLQHHSSC